MKYFYKLSILLMLLSPTVDAAPNSKNPGLLKTFNTNKENFGDNILSPRERELCTAANCALSYDTFHHCITLAQPESLKSCYVAGAATAVAAHKMLAAFKTAEGLSEDAALTQAQLTEAMAQGQQSQGKLMQKVAKNREYLKAFNNMTMPEQAIFILETAAIANPAVAGLAHKTEELLAKVTKLASFDAEESDLFLNPGEAVDKAKQKATAEAIRVLGGQMTNLVKGLNQLLDKIPHKAVRSIAKKALKMFACTPRVCANCFPIALECIVEYKLDGDDMSIKGSHPKCAKAVVEKIKTFGTKSQDPKSVFLGMYGKMTSQQRAAFKSLAEFTAGLKKKATPVDLKAWKQALIKKAADTFKEAEEDEESTGDSQGTDDDTE